jgi:LPS-assembly protein
MGWIVPGIGRARLGATILAYFRRSPAPSDSPISHSQAMILGGIGHRFLLFVTGKRERKRAAMYFRSVPVACASFAPKRSRIRFALFAGVVIAGMTFRPEFVVAAQDSGGGPKLNAVRKLTFPPRPKPPLRETTTENQMLVHAREIQYDYANERVSAIGNVQIYYNGSVLEADKVVYDQKTKRLRAEGNARLTEPRGQVTYGEVMDLSDDYRDGFVDSLRVDAAEQTSIAAARADRSSGNFSVFHSGVYTACEPCRDNPKKPPLWQIKAARIIHDQGEKMMYFEQANLEFFGMPVAYFPYFSAPDPTVKRKSGFLVPTFHSSDKTGVAVSVPYFWAIAPNYDMTLTPTMTTRQGPMMEVEYRQRTADGAFLLRGIGIKQWDPGYFVHDDGTPTPGKREFRGSFESSGQFNLSDKWGWGWDVVAPSDKTFFQDYDTGRLRTKDLIRSQPSEGVSQLYLVGRGDRSYFDARTMYFYGFSEADAQNQIPVVHPVIDYDYTFGKPVAGGELSYKVNFISLSRSQPSFDAITLDAHKNDFCTPTTADPALNSKPGNCVMRGFPGVYSRLSAQTTWRRSITDPIGQVFTPFLYARADAASLQVDAGTAADNFLPGGDTNLVQAMPAAGLEYRYPFISVQSWGTQTVEPIAQIVVRPDEGGVGRLPNEDAQSLIFDDSNLFKLDKFSGWDRTEGGTRANVGVQYTAQVNNAGFFNALFGQSYHLMGKNSFTDGGATNTGLDSGLDKTRSDYVARFAYQPSSMYTFGSRFRFDEATWDIKRFEVESRVNFDRWEFTAIYGQYAAQPKQGFLSDRQGVLGTTSIKLTSNWGVYGAIGYDVDAHKVDRTQVGLTYIDDCIAWALRYATTYGYSGNPQEKSHSIMMSFGLRTLFEGQASQKVDGLPGGF